MSQSKTILAIEAHADDAIIGAGGLLYEAARNGNRVIIVTVVSDYSTFKGTAGREDDMRSGMSNICAEYGFERIELNYPYHVIDGKDLTLKKKLAAIQEDVQADVAFIDTRIAGGPGTRRRPYRKWQHTLDSPGYC